MPLPALNADGLLPAGIHVCTLDELKAEFGRFQGNDQRPRLFGRFEAFIAEARAVGLVCSVIVDGSFVTSKPDPNDIDLILVVATDHDFAVELSPSEYTVLSKRRVHRRYGFDVLVAGDDSEHFWRYVQFFQQIRFEPGGSKGILRLNL